MKQGEITIGLIEEILSQLDVFVERCNSYILRKQWDENSNEDADAGRQDEGKFQAAMISARDNTILILSKHRRAINEYLEGKKIGIEYNEDEYLQKEFTKQYVAHIKRLKDHICNVKWEESSYSSGAKSRYEEDDEVRYKEGAFQAKMIKETSSMLDNLEQSIGIDGSAKTISKRGGNELNPYTDILMTRGIKVVQQSENLPYKDWHINSVVPPKHNKAEYIAYWDKHLSYCITGLYCGGVHFSGLLYWHLNMMIVAPLINSEHGDSQSTPMHPMFRDNELYFDYNYAIANKSKEFIFGVGARRIAKSAITTSLFSRQAFLFKHSRSSYNAPATKELEDMENDFTMFFDNRPECFEDLEKIGAFGKTGNQVDFVIKISEGAKNHKYSSIKYLNLSQTATQTEKTKTQKGAGGAISLYAIEEAGKISYSKNLTVAKPAMTTMNGELSCVALAIATGGSVHSSKDLEGDFLNAKDRGYFVGRAKEYAEYVKGFNYRQESDLQVGLFFPDVMSMYAGEKDEIYFHEYLNRKFTKEQIEELGDLKIYVTNWERAKENCAKIIEQEYKRGEEHGDMMRMFLPSQPEDAFLYKENQMFDIVAAKEKQKYLHDNNQWGEAVQLKKQNGIIKAFASQKSPCKDFPFKGGFFDAPIMIYEKPEAMEGGRPKFGCYAGGYDGVRISEETASSSMISLYIVKMINNAFRIVASYVTRPQNMHLAMEQCTLLIEWYNAITLAEKEDMGGLKDAMERNRLLHLFSRELVFDKTPYENLKTNNRGYGQPATNPKSKKVIMDAPVKYCREKIEIQNEDGEVEKEIFGIENIDDPMLLEELIKFKKGGNFDRYISWAHALVMGEELVKTGRVPRVNMQNLQDEDRVRQIWKRPTRSQRKQIVIGI
jgi:hypothetical protein